MSKRTASPTPSKLNNKKPKTSDNQPTIDRFFSGPPRLPRDQASPKGKEKAKTRSPDVPEKTNTLRDAALAWVLSEREGLNLDMVQDLEVGWKKSRMGNVVETLDVIDVDSLDEEIDVSSLSRPGPSTIRIKTKVQLSPRSTTLWDHDSTTLNHVMPFPTIFPGTPAYRDLSVDPAIFILDEPWSHGTPAPYSFLAHTLQTLSSSRSRIIIINTLTNTLRTISRHDRLSLLPALYLLSNMLAPPYSQVELGLGPSIISKAIQQISGLTPTALRRLYNTTGDVGDVAYEAKSNLRTLIPHPPLRIAAVYNSLIQISHAKGSGAAKQKQSIVEKLLVAAKGEETRFLVRTLSQNLRVGAVRTSILTALARAMVLTPPQSSLITVSELDSTYYVTPILFSESATSSKEMASNLTRDKLNRSFREAEELIRKIYVQHPNYEHIVTALLDTGLDQLSERVPLTVGIPLHPTLGSPTHSLDEIYDRIGDLPFVAEFKYDGQRAQIHGLRNQVGITAHIFSRHLEDMTSKYPDISSMVEKLFESSPEIDSFILDSEIVAVDPSDGSLKTFQELSNRARKDVQTHEIKVAVGVFAFDLMYLNGEILVGHPFRKRRTLLRNHFPRFIPQQAGIARLDHVESCESEEGREAIEEFWERAVESRCEGLMIKLLDNGEIPDDHPNDKKEKIRRKPLPATYEPDKRTAAWLKLKKDYVLGLGDSLDLVPIGAWHGNGRKAQWWSPILLALQDPDSGQLVAVCKCMSGFTDVFYKDLNDRYPQDSESCSRKNLWNCDTGGLQPQVYFKPSEVWEIRGADVTLSPVSVAALGLVSQSRGLSLRFPRFIRVRDDKTIEEASTPEFLANIWNNQQRKGKGRGGTDDGDLVDVDIEEQLEPEGEESGKE